MTLVMSLNNDHMGADVESEQWKGDSILWRGEVLTGRYAHWCYDWDGLPVDETTREFTACTCFDETEDVVKFKETLKSND